MGGGTNRYRYVPVSERFNVDDYPTVNLILSTGLDHRRRLFKEHLNQISNYALHRDFFVEKLIKYLQ